MSLEAAAVFGTCLSAVAGAGAILVALHTYKRQVNAELFLRYTARYQEVMDSFPVGSRGARLKSDGEPPEPSEALSLAVLRYLNLCSEEFYLCKRGYLSKDVWHIWEAELKRTLASPLLRREWTTLRSEFSAYPDFGGYVDQVQRRESEPHRLVHSQGLEPAG